MTEAIGDDTNYVAAMEQAAGHLPADSARPAIIVFTDGRHEAPGVPVGDVAAARDRLFAERSPFALLPVGMGVDADDRPRLEAGLADLRITRDFERCDGGALDWPNVVFDSAEAAGQAVGLALQDVSCTFTVEPTPTPAPTASPEPPAPVRNIRLTPGDSVIEVTWFAPDDRDAAPVQDYLVRCQPSAGGDWVESTEGVSTETSTRLEGLANGVEYACEVAVVRESGEEPWERADSAAAPFGRPPTPAKPAVQALNQGARLGVAMPDGAPVTGIAYECSTDGGATWSVASEVPGSRTVVDIAGLANGTEYVCRVSATNPSGVSDTSPVSDAFRPCGGLIDCNPLVLPLLGLMGLLLAAAAALAFWRWYAGRQVYVTAQVDHFASVSLGRGPRVGLTFVRRGPNNRLAGVVPADGRAADLRIRYAGGETFELRAAGRSVKTRFGRQVQITDKHGQTHSVVVRAYDEPPR